ncbi:MAG: RDD family protein [Flavobacteriales bacterium]|nr:RDD family protein [Flavobacteriales bacterium]
MSAGESIRYAGFWRRLFANIFDGIIISPVIIFIYYNLFVIKDVKLHFALFMIIILYKPMLEFSIGGTFGKRIIGVRVKQSTLVNLSFISAVLRNIAWIISYIVALLVDNLLFHNPSFQSINGFNVDSFITLANMYANIAMREWANIFLLIFILGSIVIPFNKKKRGLHDFWSGSVCIRT